LVSGGEHAAAFNPAPIEVGTSSARSSAGEPIDAHVVALRPNALEPRANPAEWLKVDPALACHAQIVMESHAGRSR
jgi:hypothetical protein